jgi:hypothetical protein
MAFDAEADTAERGVIFLNDMGDLEITWEPQNDEKVRLIIESKMRAGVQFFVMKPIIGDVLHIRKKMTKLSDLTTNSVKIKDKDIADLFSAGDVGLFRSPNGTIETAGAIRDLGADGKPDYAARSRKAVRNRSVAVPALAGG